MDTGASIKNAFKWAAISELSVKLITPILNAVLARILLPEDYAPLATITMLISFCEVFVESGFKKYLIQHQFADAQEEKNAFCVAFWSTVAVSLLIWGIIVLFCRPISAFLGNPDIWLAVAVSGVILPMYAMMGIFNATIQKQLAFKKLFFVRIVTASIPLFITIPLAAAGLKYWSLVIGNILSTAAQMIALKIQSKFKVQRYYSFSLLKIMFKDTAWTLIDGVVVWLTAWVDSLLINQQMSEYYLGLYRNSLSTITSLFSMVTAAVTPVLFVGLTKYQNDNRDFSTLFIRTQRILAAILIPAGVGVLLYKEFAVAILFGDTWSEAANIIGINALTLAVRTVYISICSDVYRAKGAFRVPLYIQIADLCMLIPANFIAVQYGFWALVYVRAAMRVVLVIPEFIILRKYLQMSVGQQLKSQIPVLVSTAAMTVVALFARQFGNSFTHQVASIALCMGIYFAVLFLCFPKVRKELLGFHHTNIG